MGGACGTHCWMISANKILIGMPEGKRPLLIHRRIWEDNIKVELCEIWLEGVNWIHLAQDRDRWRGLVNTVTILRVT
jgi:hypothetical protein